MMKRTIFLLWLGAALVQMPAAWAQDQTQTRLWVQIEARPTEEQAAERARAYAEIFPDVSSYRLASGWYGIVLGPYGPEVAQLRLDDLLGAGLIPRDSFIADGTAFREPFMQAGAPVAAEPGPEPMAEPMAVPGPEDLPEDAPPVVELPRATDPLDIAPAPEEAPDDAPAVVATPAPPPLPDESPEQARQSESALSLDERRQIQMALQWFGHYASSIDGAFGPGTRASMSAWQQATATEPTGILTTRQRADLLARFRAEQAELGLEPVTETQAGIGITLPTALVRFDRYDPPFVHWLERDGSGVQVMLISEPGDQGTLHGLYEILQTLETVPPDGLREKRAESFTIEGRSDRVASYTHAELKGGLIKGYMLVWNPADDARMARVLTAMRSSFRSLGDRALDPGLVALTADQRRGMLAGLDLRQPKLSRSGFFLDDKGTVVTTLQAVEGCARITIDRDTDARVTLTDPALGLAVLAPQAPLAPRATAAFATTAARPGTAVAAAGYPYGEKLTAPTLTFGALEDLTGLEGEPHLLRLHLDTLDGDAGAPVLDGTGAVIGMLLPKPTGTRQLPAKVAFALSSEALTARLQQADLQPRPTAEGAGTGTGKSPEDLARIGDGLAALVSCWD
ncbi:putative peptidoglycan binding protein [Cereibacter ovatus]|uniref:Putative peptidoglycan binding protein n=2 Tax=Cereibacter ovatus TaxID=439529 RepID=A0A285CNK4_9RHOB|nr:putative peptidoglycan binding protein [Cereibacter ovatus]